MGGFFRLRLPGAWGFGALLPRGALLFPAGAVGGYGCGGLCAAGPPGSGAAAPAPGPATAPGSTYRQYIVVAF